MYATLQHFLAPATIVCLYKNMSLDLASKASVTLFVLRV
jgi:hypothetical protein